MIQQIFTTFPKMNQLTIENSSLQSIELSETVQLDSINLINNNISRIENNTFISQRNLVSIVLVDNGIDVVESNAFAGQDELMTLVITGNNIKEFAPETFHPLYKIFYLTLSHNKLTRISEELFAKNAFIVNLYLQENEIEEISPRFRAAFRVVEKIDLEGNACVDREFFFSDKDELLRMNWALKKCFNNFIGGVPETRNINMQFKGSLAMYDEFGNIIGRVN